MQIVKYTSIESIPIEVKNLLDSYGVSYTADSNGLSIVGLTQSQAASLRALGYSVDYTGTTGAISVQMNDAILRALAGASWMQNGTDGYSTTVTVDGVNYTVVRDSSFSQISETEYNALKSKLSLALIFISSISSPTFQ